MVATRLNDCNYIKCFDGCFTHKMYNVIDEFKNGLTDIIQDKEEFFIYVIDYFYNDFLEENNMGEYLKFILKVIQLTQCNIVEIKKNLLGTKEQIKIFKIKCNPKEDRAIIYFSDNTRIVFKNKSLENEDILNKILRWGNLKISKENKLYSMKLIKLYKCGFTEYIEPIECKNNKETLKYYFNLGQILVLLYIFNYTDFRADNIIHKGKYPIVKELDSLEMIQGKNIECSLLTKDVVQDILDKSVYSIDILDKNKETLTREYIDSVKKGFEAMYDLILKHKMELVDKIKGLININSAYLSSGIHKVYGLNDNDLKRQLYFLDIRFENIDYKRIPIVFSDNHKLNLINNHNRIEVANKLGDHIIQKSIIGFNNQTTTRNWINTIQKGSEMLLSSRCNNLSDGNSGISLFLLYLGMVSRKDYFIKAAIEAMENSMDKLNNLQQLKNPNIIDFKEIAGEIYILSRIYSVTKDENIKRASEKGIYYLINIINKDIDVNGAQDVISITEVLLSIYENKDYEDIKVEVVNLLNLIYKNMVKDQHKLKQYYGEIKAIVGLAKLLQVTSNKEIECTIEKLISFQRGSIMQLDDGQNFMDVYSEILLSRVILKEINYKDNLIDEELNNALEYTIKNGFNVSDYSHNMYIRNLDILEYAAEVLKDKGLKNRCCNTFNEIVEKIINPAINEELNYQNKSLSFMNGLSGYGYSLIRGESKEEVPRMLWFQ